jgi:hypothetical protein
LTVNSRGKCTLSLQTPISLPYLCITKTEKHIALQFGKRFGSSVG